MLWVRVGSWFPLAEAWGAVSEPTSIALLFVVELRVLDHLFAKQLMCRLSLTATGCVRCANAYDGVHVLERQLLYVERTNKQKIARRLSRRNDYCNQ